MPKDTASLIKATILPRVTCVLERLATLPLHIYTMDDNGHFKMHCQFGGTLVPNIMHQLTSISKVVVYDTDDLAFQAMVIGREGAPSSLSSLQNGEE